MDDPTELQRLRQEIDAEVRDGGTADPAKLREEYVAYANRNRALILAFSSRVRLLLVLLTVTTLIGGSLSAYLIVRDSERSREAKTLATEIKASRYRSVLLSCEEQNTRHEAAYNTLGLLVGVESSQAQDGAERRGIKTGSQVAKALIDALVPFNSDCAAYARERTSANPK